MRTGVAYSFYVSPGEICNQLVSLVVRRPLMNVRVMYVSLKRAISVRTFYANAADTRIHALNNRPL